MNIFYLLLLCLSFTSCQVLSSMDELNVLGGYSREKESQQRLVKFIDDNYDFLTRTIAQGLISGYKDEASWTRAFGDPVLKKDLPDGGQRWLYRSAKDKTYVYFDRKGQLMKWEKEPCPPLF
ncbi:MAG: hypothetical protein HQL13_02105 [Candidatus Omnitrophica bacterium]|nr:hypothetical protein [Candidatus Omnitrophota bacterium]